MISNPLIRDFENVTTKIFLNSMHFRKPFLVDVQINQEMQKKLPLDVWKKIFVLLDRRDIGRTARVCRLFNNLIENKVYWEAMKILIPESVFELRVRQFENRDGNIDVATSISKGLVNLLDPPAFPIPSTIPSSYFQNMLEGIILDFTKDFMNKNSSEDQSPSL